MCNLEAFNKLGHHRCSGCNNNGGGSDGIFIKGYVPGEFPCCSFCLTCFVGHGLDIYGMFGNPLFSSC